VAGLEQVEQNSSRAFHQNRSGAEREEHRGLPGDPATDEQDQIQRTSSHV